MSDPRDAPKPGCDCKICVWARSHNLPSRLIKPSDPQWNTLLVLASRYRP
jgi:hypothetical protein